MHDRTSMGEKLLYIYDRSLSITNMTITIIELRYCLLQLNQVVYRLVDV